MDSHDYKHDGHIYVSIQTRTEASGGPWAALCSLSSLGDLDGLRRVRVTTGECKQCCDSPLFSYVINKYNQTTKLIDQLMANGCTELPFLNGYLKGMADAGDFWEGEKDLRRRIENADTPRHSTGLTTPIPCPQIVSKSMSRQDSKLARERISPTSRSPDDDDLAKAGKRLPGSFKCNGRYFDFQGADRPCQAGAEGCGGIGCRSLHAYPVDTQRDRGPIRWKRSNDNHVDSDCGLWHITPNYGGATRPESYVLWFGVKTWERRGSGQTQRECKDLAEAL